MLKRLVAAFLSVFSALGFGKAPTVPAIVTYVSDGDTLSVRFEDRAVATVRLADIDAPETAKGPEVPGQPYGVEARRELASMVLSRRVDLHCVDTDIYGRLVCDVYLGSAHVNRAMVQRGAAWAASRRYLRDQKVARAQHEAQRQRVGLWAQRDPMEPWQWRRVR